MKKHAIILLLLVMIVIGVPTVWYVWYKNASNKGRENNFQQQLGSYVLDIHKTALGRYSKDSEVYNNLCITFNADSTFNMNMKVPFICDSIGRWNAGNMKEWNYLWYKSWGYIDYKEGKGNQFTRPYMESADTFFLLNGATPKEGAEFIQEIYFRKISR